MLSNSNKKIFHVSFPASARQIFEVQADSEDEVIEQCLQGECDYYDIDEIETCFDKNLAIVKENENLY